MRRDLDVLVLCDAALDAGRAIADEEEKLKTAFIDAKVELNIVLQAIAKAAGGIRGHERCFQEKSSYDQAHHRIYVIPSTTNEGPYIEWTTGRIGDCETPSHLIAIWRALPGIMSQHIAACEEASRQYALASEKMATVWHGSQVLRSFTKEVMPQAWKEALMRRTLNDADLQAALTAAAATDEDDAPLKILREQMESDDDDGSESPDDASAR
jgi:hypothetical protein